MYNQSYEDYMQNPLGYRNDMIPQGNMNMNMMYEMDNINNMNTYDMNNMRRTIYTTTSSKYANRGRY